MSFRPAFPIPNATFAPRYNSNNFVPPSNSSFNSKPSDGHQPNMPSNFSNYSPNPTNINTNHPVIPDAYFSPRYVTNTTNQELLQPNRFASQQAVSSVPFPYPNSSNAYPTNSQISGPQHPSFNASAMHNQYYSNQPIRQNFNSNPISNFQINSNNAYLNSDQRNVPPQRFPHSEQNTINSNLQAHVNFQGYQNNICHGTHRNNVPTTFNTLPPNFSVSNENVNNQSSISVYNNSSVVVTPTMQAPPSQWENNSFLKIPPPSLKDIPSHPLLSNNIQNPLSENELKLADFLAKLMTVSKKKENKIMIPEYRSALRDAFLLIKSLSKKKLKLKSLIKASESEWNSEMQSIKSLQNQLSEMCSLISSSDHLNIIMKKLKHIKKKRNQKKKTKLNKLAEKIKAEQNRKELHQEIDKWFDDIKEKNMKLKREVEMQKEADFILLEVRRKIQEANRTIEKIKVFEKLRSARQANAVQKGLHILPEYNENFEKKMSILKEIMLKQLVDYEAEEKALKVMLETEQEGQLEEKTKWELKRIKTLQQKKQNHIIECLFGISEDPLPQDPLYLFHKYHTSANNTIENLIQIRNQWDLHTAEDGESIPQHWVVPVTPSDSSWEKCLITSKN